jgi:alkanesulfonate monooxygenase SsuD/methylene tetrahydromethanopterin reductase-like flavin-dependent oxidoreductase (luciferase family)/predicted kinase
MRTMASSPAPGLPDPALVVLVGASGAGKSHWAQARYRRAEIVSSDDLRGVVGSGRHDLDASAEAFHLLDLIVAGRLRRGLTTVVDTLGLDADRRRGYLALARAHEVPAAAVAFDTPAEVCRARNAARDRPVPAPALAQQLRTAAEVVPHLADEGWDHVSTVPHDASEPPEPTARSARRADAGDDGRLEVVLQVSRFPWGEDPAAWLSEVALAAEAAGLAGLALMDHLVQIPQVGRAWEPIPEPWVTLGLLAGLPTSLRLGTLVSPVTFRPAGITAKAAATLDVLTGGRAFLGVGAGWWGREHAGFGLPFPPPKERLDALEAGIETMRALWSPGTKGYDGARVALPETTCYPRPVGPLPVIVGGSGARTLRIAGRCADGCNVGSDPTAVERAASLVGAACAEVGRDPSEVALTVLDLPVIGHDREDTWARVERLRGRTGAAAYARAHHAGTPGDHADRWRRLQDRGVSTVFVALGDLERADDLDRLAAAVSALSA